MMLQLRCADPESRHDFANAEYNTDKRHLILYYSSLRDSNKNAVCMHPDLKGIPYETVELRDLDWDHRYEMQAETLVPFIPKALSDKIIVPLNTKGLRKTR